MPNNIGFFCTQLSELLNYDNQSLMGIAEFENRTYNLIEAQMVKVVLPLGSEQARGGFAKYVIFQGQTAKKWRAPSDPKSDGQLLVRQFFADVSKMIRAAGLVTKGYFRENIGERWFSTLYGLIKRDEQQFYANALDEFDGFSSGDKESWADNAPFNLTWGDPGQLFFCMVRFLYALWTYQVKEMYGLEEYTSAQSDDARLWWTGMEVAMSGVKLKQSSTQLMTADQDNVMSFDVSEFASPGMLDGSGPWSEVVIVQGGVHNIIGYVELAADDQEFTFKVLKNGTDIVCRSFDVGSAFGNRPKRIVDVIEVVAADTLKLLLMPEGGNNVTAFKTLFEVVRLGPRISA